MIMSMRPDKEEGKTRAKGAEIGGIQWAMCQLNGRKARRPKKRGVER